MELTTVFCILFFLVMLFMMSKIQNLNGTHNSAIIFLRHYPVVYDVKDTKFEWNSQLIHNSSLCFSVVYDVKDTKFEWNSQLISFFWGYKLGLFMMSKIQNLNGTHNIPFEFLIYSCVVYDVKDTKFEWNSQQTQV